jgi:photosystem II stability/assembly factor-like uncharacterized protein
MTLSRIAVLLLLICSSCTKEYSLYPFEKIDVPVTDPVRDLVNKENGNWLICGGSEGHGFILETRNFGVTWQVKRNDFDNSINCMLFTDSLTGYAADRDLLIYKTTDGGISWNPFYANSWPLSVNRHLRDIWFINDSTGFVCGGKNLGNGVLFTTGNSGSFWGFREYNHEYRTLCFNSDMTGIMAGHGSVMRTTNGGISFESVNMTGYYFTASAVDKNGRFVLSDFNGHIFRSADEGQTWTEIRKGSGWGREKGRINCMDVSSSGIIACAGPDGFLTWSTDNGNSWEERNSFGNTEIYQVIFINEKEALFTGAGGGLFKVKF